jgi:thioester reductase-like protein
MPRRGYDDVVLITGFPAFYARKMLETVLLLEPRSRVYIVVLKKLAADAIAELAVLPSEQRDRVVMLIGDAAAMDLGLSGAEFREVTDEVNRIHHMAHVSYVGVEPATAEALNVYGAAEIVELARAASSLRCLVFHSTAAVSGTRRGLVLEEDLDPRQGFHSIIDETRMRGELIARRAMADVPIAVVRPTTLVGDSGTGEMGRFDGPYLLVLLILAAPAEVAIPLPSKGDAPLNIVPVDFVVRAAHAIGLHPKAIGRTFHLADPRPFSARRVFDLVARAGGRRSTRGYIPSNLAKAVLRAPGLERFVRSPRAFVEQLALQVRYDTRNADEVLAGSAIVCPPFDAYVDQLVAVVKERVRSRREQPLEPEDEDEDPLS